MTRRPDGVPTARGAVETTLWPIGNRNPNMTGGEIPDIFLPQTARPRRCTQYFFLQGEMVTARPERKNRNAWHFNSVSSLAWPYKQQSYAAQTFQKNLARVREVTTVNARTHGSRVRPEKSAIYITRNALLCVVDTSGHQPCFLDAF